MENQIHDYLLDKTYEASSLRVDIVVDRRFNVPSWFYKYITQTDIIYIMRYIDEYLGFEDQIRSLHFFKTWFAGFHNINYNKLLPTIVATGFSTLLDKDLADSDMRQYCKAIISNKDKLNESHLVVCIKLYALKRKMIPNTIFECLMRFKLSRYWKVSSNKSGVILDIMRSMDYNELNYVYPTICKNKWCKNSNPISYSQYVDSAGNWFDPNQMGFSDFMTRYVGVVSNIRNDKVFCTKQPISYTDEVRDGIKDMIKWSTKGLVIDILKRAVRVNINNVQILYSEFKNDDVNYDLYQDLVYFSTHGLNLNSVEIEDLTAVLHYCKNKVDVLINYLFKTTIVHPRQTISVISELIGIEDIPRLISSIPLNILTGLLNVNPFMKKMPGVTFIDMVIMKMSEFNTMSITVLKRAFDSSTDALYSLTMNEIKSMYRLGVGTTDKYRVYAEFPQLIRRVCDDSRNGNDMSFSDIQSIYKIDTKVIRYIPARKINRSLLYKHIVSYGFTYIEDFNDYGIEHILTMTNMIDLMKPGRGIGHVLDIKDQTVRNAVVKSLLHQYE